jgi:hypothetical protein
MIQIIIEIEQSPKSCATIQYTPLIHGISVHIHFKCDTELTNDEKTKILFILDQLNANEMIEFKNERGEVIRQKREWTEEELKNWAMWNIHDPDSADDCDREGCDNG